MTITGRILENKWIILISLLYSIIILAFSPINLPIADSAKYAELAGNLVNNGSYISNFMPDASTQPFYPFILAASLFIFGNFYMSALPAIIAFFLTITSFYLGMEITGNKKIAYLSTLLLISIPLVTYNSMRILTDTTFLIFLMLTFIFYSKLLKHGKTEHSVIMGIFFGLALLTRMVALLIPAIIIIHTLFLLKYKRNMVLKHMVIFLFIGLLVFSPWLAWKFSTGTFNEYDIASNAASGLQGHLVTLIENLSPSGAELGTNKIQLDILIPFQLVNLARLLMTLFLFISPILFLVSIYILYRFIFKPRMGRNHGFLFLWFFAFVIFHILYPVSLDSRFLLPAAVPLIIIASSFIVYNIDKKKAMATLLILHFLIASAVLAIDSQTRWDRLQTTAFLETGDWLQENTPSDAIILPMGIPATSINFYANRKTVNLDSNNVFDVIAFSDFEMSESAFNEIAEEHKWRISEIKTLSDNKYMVKIYQFIS